MNNIKSFIFVWVILFAFNAAHAANWLGYNPLYQAEAAAGHNGQFNKKQADIDSAIKNGNPPADLRNQLTYWSNACGIAQKSKATAGVKAICNEGSACLAVPLSVPPTCFTSTTTKSTITCQARTQGYYFDTTSNTCRTCTAPTVMNDSTHRCEACPAPTVYSNGKCVACQAPSVYNQSTGQCGNCPSATPYFDATTTPPQCRACETPTLYNTTTGQCEACPAPTTYNAASKTCEPCPPPSIYNNTTHACAACDAPTVYNPSSKACAACASPTVYNPGTKTCAACPSPTVYNAASKSCEACPDQRVYTNGACASCTGATPNYDADTKSCLSDTGKSCLQTYNQGNTVATRNFLKNEVIRLNRVINITRMSGGYTSKDTISDLNAKTPCCNALNNGANCPTQ